LKNFLSRNEKYSLQKFFGKIFEKKVIHTFYEKIIVQNIFSYDNLSKVVTALEKFFKK